MGESVRIVGVLFVGLLVAGALGCAGAVAELDANKGLVHQKCDLVIHFKDASDREFIDEHWAIDNWRKYLKQTASSKTDAFARKDGRDYLGRIRIDMNNDGNAEVYPIYFSDLELTHKENNGYIWVNARELPEHLGSTKAEVFLRNYAESLSGTEFQPRNGAFSVSGGASRGFATKIIEEDKIEFGQWSGVIATIEVARLEQLRLDPEHRYGFVRVLFVVIDPFEKMFDEMASSLPRSGKGLLMVGYFNSPDYFRENLEDFYEFLGQFSVGGKRVRPNFDELLAADKEVASAPGEPAQDEAPPGEDGAQQPEAVGAVSEKDEPVEPEGADESPAESESSMESN